MPHSLPHNLKNLCHSQITTAPRLLSIYIYIYAHCFHEILMPMATFCIVFICLKPGTKRCKLHGAPSIWPLESRRPGILHVILIGRLPFLTWKKYTQKTLFSVAHQEHSSTEQRTEIFKVPAWQCDFYEILTRSLRDLCEIWVLQGKAAGKGSRARHSTLLYSSLFFPTDLSTLLFSALL